MPPSTRRFSTSPRRFALARGVAPHRLPHRLRYFFPSTLTVFGLCLGLSALRFAWISRWQEAVLCVLGASLFDLADGRVARLLHSTSDFGAELDSLADFVCYGVAPAMLVYVFSLSRWGGIGWALCLFFVTCSALRLARFNVHRLLPNKVSWGDTFFIGVPAPGGSFIAFVPFFLGFALDLQAVPPWWFAGSLALGGSLMVSRLPTIAFKRFQFSKRNAPFLLLGVALFTGCLLSYPWFVLFAVICLYVLSIPLSTLWIRRLRRT